MILGTFGDPRMPFTRPVEATSNFRPRSLDTGFVPDLDPYPTIMLPRMTRYPANIRQPLAAEPAAMPGAVSPVTASATAIPPSVSALKQRSMRMMSVPLLMALGVIPSPRAGVRVGLNPNRLVGAGRKPGVP